MINFEYFCPTLKKKVHTKPIIKQEVVSKDILQPLPPELEELDKESDNEDID